MGSWVVTSGVISPLIRVIITLTLLLNSLKTTHDPPSRVEASVRGCAGVFACVGFSGVTLALGLTLALCVFGLRGLGFWQGLGFRGFGFGVERLLS